MNLLNRWNALSQRDRMRWLIVGTFLLVGLYGLLVYPSSNAALERQKNLISRKADRMEKRLGDIPQVGFNASSAQGRLRELDKAIAALDEQLLAVRERFGGEQAQQDLLLSLSALASRSGLHILSQGGATGGQGDAVTNAPQEQVDRQSGRPLLRIRARGSYWELLSFLQGLRELHHASAPLALQVTLSDAQAPAKDKAKQNALPPGMLDVAMTLTL